MKYTNLIIAESEESFSIHDFCFPDIINPSLHKGKMAQTHYFFPAAKKSAISLCADLKGVEGNCKLDFANAKNEYSIDFSKFPYGQTEPQWWDYCLAPHSYLPLNEGKIQVGLNFFNRFLHLDLQTHSAQLVNPGVGNEMLSSTNFFDSKKNELWFASWPVCETVRRMINPRENVRVTIWKFSIQDKHLKQVWQGVLGDALHQLSLSPDRRFLILTELGLRPADTIPLESQDQAPLAWRRVREKGLVPSKVLILNLLKGEEWRLEMPTAGHVEFDPADPEICYLSAHNIGLFGVKVGIFGSGMIKKIQLKNTGPELVEEFSHSNFQRITTHVVFLHREKVLIGVSGYPDKVFLIDAATMKLYKTIEIDQGENVDTAQFPHICQQDSYGIAASTNGETIFISGTGYFKIADIDTGRFISEQKIENYDINSCFTGHLGTLSMLQGNKL